MLNLPRREVRINGREIEMTAREFNLLEYLTRSPGRVYTRTQILERVWDLHFDPSTNIVDVYIQRLRKKIGNEKSLIRNGPGRRLPHPHDAAGESSP